LPQPAVCDRVLEYRDDKLEQFKSFQPMNYPAASSGLSKS